MKRILVFSTAYLPLVGGAEIAIKEITDRISDVEFDLICARIKKSLLAREKVGNVNVWRLGSGRGKIDKFLLLWQGARLAKRLQAQKGYDAIWAIMASFGGLAALKFKKGFPDIPYVLTLQEGDTPKHIHSRAKWLGPYYSQMFRKADYITAISNYLKDYALAQGAKCRIEVVPNGVGLQKFKIPAFAKATAGRQNSKFKADELKSQLGIKKDEKVVITVSRLVEKNGIGDLIEAFAKLSLQGGSPEGRQTTNYKLKTKLLIIGSGPLEQSLKLKVKGLGLENKILFLGDIPNDEVPKYLAMADVFVRPSLAEGLGNAFLEAMAVGVPIIGTPVGGIPDFLVDRETGLFCEVNNPQSITERIQLLFSDENLRQKLIENGQKLVVQNYNWDLIAQKMENIFNNLNKIVDNKRQ